MRSDSFFRGVFLLYCVEAGLFLLIAPWLPAWNRAAAFLPFGSAQDLLLNTWVRSAISSFGLMHLVWGLHDVDLFFRRHATPRLENPETAGHQ
ncbi:MAG: hypothetical protein ABI639_12390 [Thermoanaerobaculia bacterium]